MDIQQPLCLTTFLIQPWEVFPDPDHEVPTHSKQVGMFLPYVPHLGTERTVYFQQSQADLVLCSPSLQGKKELRQTNEITRCNRTQWRFRLGPGREEITEG